MTVCVIEGKGAERKRERQAGRQTDRQRDGRGGGGGGEADRQVDKQHCTPPAHSASSSCRGPGQCIFHPLKSGLCYMHDFTRHQREGEGPGGGGGEEGGSVGWWLAASRPRKQHGSASAA